MPHSVQSETQNKKYDKKRHWLEHGSKIGEDNAD